MKKKILLFAGKKRSGKDYLSDTLISRINGDFVKVSFAKKLKLICASIMLSDFNTMEELKNNESTLIINKESFIDNWTNAILKMAESDGSLLNISLDKIKHNLDNFNIFETVTIVSEKGAIIELSARDVMQNVGESFKSIFENRDIWAILLAKDLLKISKNFIISDYRYVEEYNVLSTLLKNYDVITIKVIGKNYHDNTDQHISETALENSVFDYYLNNTIYDWTSVYEQLNALNTEIFKGK